MCNAFITCVKWCSTTIIVSGLRKWFVRKQGTRVLSPKVSNMAGHVGQRNKRSSGVRDAPSSMGGAGGAGCCDGSAGDVDLSLCIKWLHQPGERWFHSKTKYFWLYQNYISSFVTSCEIITGHLSSCQIGMTKWSTTFAILKRSNKCLFRHSSYKLNDKYLSSHSIYELFK